MGANAIEIYRKNSKTIVCTVSGLANLVDYTATTTAVITKTGDIVGLVITFTLTPTLTDVPYKIYHYDIVIEKVVEEVLINEYTIVQDVLEIKKSVSN
jgi:hypothetical protein